MTGDDGLILKQGSPAEDVGRNTSIPADITTDIVGSDLMQNTTVNMGAYEDTKCNLVTRLYVDCI